MLDPFGTQQGGFQCWPLVRSLQRIFGTTIFFDADTRRAHVAVFPCARLNFMTEGRIWYSRDPDQRLLPQDCQIMIILSDEFYHENLDHLTPRDLEAAKVLSPSLAAEKIEGWQLTGRRPCDRF